MQIHPYAASMLALIVLWLLYKALTGNWNPWKLIEGADGRPSASKLQWFLWTIVILFAYVAIYAARVQKNDLRPITEIPTNVLIAMGFSITTMAAAKGITASYATSGRFPKVPAAEKPKPDAPNAAVAAAVATAPQDSSKPTTRPAGPGDLVKDDDGYPDLSKMQMLAWTLVAVVASQRRGCAGANPGTQARRSVTQIA